MRPIIGYSFILVASSLAQLLSLGPSQGVSAAASFHGLGATARQDGHLNNIRLKREPKKKQDLYDELIEQERKDGDDLGAELKFRLRERDQKIASAKDKLEADDIDELARPRKHSARHRVDIIAEGGPVLPESSGLDPGPPAADIKPSLVGSNVRGRYEGANWSQPERTYFNVRDKSGQDVPTPYGGSQSGLGWGPFPERFPVRDGKKRSRLGLEGETGNRTTVVIHKPHGEAPQQHLIIPA